MRSLASLAMLAKVPVRISCLGVVPQRISAAGVFGDLPLSCQFLHNFFDILHAHEKNQRSDAGQRLPVDIAFFFGRVFMAGDKSHRGSQTSVRKRNAGISGNGNRGGDAGNNFKGYFV